MIVIEKLCSNKFVKVEINFHPTHFVIQNKSRLKNNKMEQNH